MQHAAPDPDAQRYELFIRLFAQHESGLRAFVRSLFPGREHAEEILQETCVVLWRKFAHFEAGSEFLAWACTIARFEALKYRRRLARDRHIFHPELLEFLADEAIGEMDRRVQEFNALETCIQKLGPRQRDLVSACYAPGTSIKEAAEGLGQSATTISKALNWIRILLLECIEASLAGESTAEQPHPVRTGNTTSNPHREAGGFPGGHASQDV